MLFASSQNMHVTDRQTELRSPVYHISIAEIRGKNVCQKMNLQKFALTATQHIRITDVYAC